MPRLETSVRWFSLAFLLSISACGHDGPLAYAMDRRCVCIYLDGGTSTVVGSNTLCSSTEQRARDMCPSLPVSTPGCVIIGPCTCDVSVSSC